MHAPGLRMHPIHYFVHVPKTAGMTVKTWLREVFTRDELIFVYPGPVSEGGDFRCFPVPELLRRAAEIPASVRLFFGHFPFDPRQLLNERCRGLGFVREPRARIVSWGRFVARCGDELGPELAEVGAALRAGRSLPAVFGERGGIPELDNGIVRMFARNYGPVGSVGEAELQRAVENVERHFDYVGHVDRFDASMRRIAEILDRPWQGRASANTSPGGRSEGVEVDAEVDAWLDECTAFDRRFVDWIVERFHGEG